MYCVANICYVCLENKRKLIRNINNSSVNKDIIRIIGSLPFNLAWLKTKRNLLICEQCCVRLRETYQFLEMCLRKSALLEGYMDKLNSTPISNTDNEAKLLVYLSMKHKDIDEAEREIQLEDEEIYTFKWQPNIEETYDSLVKEGIISKNEVDDKQQYPTINSSTETIKLTEDVFVDLDDSFIEEKTGNGTDTEEYRMDNNSTDSMDNESDSEISVNSNVHIANTDGVTSGFTSKQLHTSSEKDMKTAVTKPYNCLTCSKSFSAKSRLKRHTRIHTGEKPYKCTECKKCFGYRSTLVRHMLIHTGEKPYKCSACKICFRRHSQLVNHMQIHTGEKPYKCTECGKCFGLKSSLVNHMLIHTGEKPYKCSTCKKCFRRHSYLVSHMLVHTDEKPYKCSECGVCFKSKSNLNRHQRAHNK